MINYSIIIPHFTSSDTSLLERAVNSIPQRDDIEIVVVDNSLLPIDSNLFNSRKNVSVLYSDNTKGAGGARNVGIENSKGKWLLFLDADDFFTENAFNAFDKYLDSNFDIVFFKMTSCYSDTYEKADRHNVYAGIVDKYIINKDEYNLRYKFSSPCAKMINSEFVKVNKIFYDEVPASNDVIFALKIGLKANLIFADNSEVYCATINRGSITRTTSLKNIESQFDVRIRKNKMLKENGFKKDASLIFVILKSRKYGFKIFAKLLYKTIITGNLFVGCNNWLSTLYNILFKKNKIEKRYNVIK